MIASSVRPLLLLLLALCFPRWPLMSVCLAFVVVWGPGFVRGCR